MAARKPDWLIKSVTSTSHRPPPKPAALPRSQSDAPENLRRRINHWSSPIRRPISKYGLVSAAIDSSSRLCQNHSSFTLNRRISQSSTPAGALRTQIGETGKSHRSPIHCARLTGSERSSAVATSPEIQGRWGGAPVSSPVGGLLQSLRSFARTLSC